MLTNLKRKFAALTQMGEKKVITLCYHRVAEDEADPWNLSVSPRNFEEQLKIVAKYFTVASIPELVTNFEGVAGRRTVCISFDDGYTDNHTAAFPLLKQYHVPACFFIASAFIGQAELYWWDELTEIFLTERLLPRILEVTIADVPFRFDLSDSAQLSDEDAKTLKEWKYHQQAPTVRCEIYLKLWEHLRPLPYAEQLAIVQRIKDWSGVREEPSSEKLPMTVGQLQEIKNNSLFTIGLHTMHHVALGYHSPSLQEEEILGSRAQLKAMLGDCSNVLSFPYGSFNEESLALSRKHSLLASFTSEKRIQTSRSDKHQLGRYTVKDWSGETFKRKLDEWFSKS